MSFWTLILLLVVFQGHTWCILLAKESHRWENTLKAGQWELGDAQLYSISANFSREILRRLRAHSFTWCFAHSLQEKGASCWQEWSVWKQEKDKRLSSVFRLLAHLLSSVAPFAPRSDVARQPDCWCDRETWIDQTWEWVSSKQQQQQSCQSGQGKELSTKAIGGSRTAVTMRPEKTKARGSVARSVSQHSTWGRCCVRFCSNIPTIYQIWQNLCKSQFLPWTMNVKKKSGIS